MHWIQSHLQESQSERRGGCWPGRRPFLQQQTRNVQLFVKIEGSCRNQSLPDLKLNVFHLTFPASYRPSKALKFNILLQTLQTCVGTLQVADVSSSTVQELSKPDLLQPLSRSLLRTVLSFSNMDLEKNIRMYSSCFCSNLQSVCGFLFVCLFVSG